MFSRAVALLVWAAVAALAAYWGSRLLARPGPVPPQATLATTPPPQGDLTRLFGAAPVAPAEAAPAPPPADSRFKLLGVVARRGNTGGVALIAIDGKPARAYRVGAQVDGDNVLQSVAAREVTIGPRGGVAAVALQLPALPAAVSTPLPPAVPGVAPVPASPQPQPRGVFPGVTLPATGGAVPPQPGAFPRPAIAPTLPAAFQRPMTAPPPATGDLQRAAPSPAFALPPATSPSPGELPPARYRPPGEPAPTMR